MVHTQRDMSPRPNQLSRSVRIVCQGPALWRVARFNTANQENPSSSERLGLDAEAGQSPAAKICDCNPFVRVDSAA